MPRNSTPTYVPWEICTGRFMVVLFIGKNSTQSKYPLSEEWSDNVGIFVHCYSIQQGKQITSQT